MRTVFMLLAGWCALAAAACSPGGLTGKSDIKTDEEVIFFRTYGHKDDGNWRISIHGWIYEPEKNDIARRQTLKALVHSLGLEEEDATKEIFQRRAHLFLADNESRKKVSIRLVGQTHTLPESSAAGHFRGTVRLADAEAKEMIAEGQEGWLSFEAVLRKGDRRSFRGRAQLIEETGLSVVSDIDDTIKVTEVRNRAALLANTFLREFRPVAGMAPLYRGWLAQGAVFHYVSASPWQLYPPLEAFREEHRFPPGTFHLKNFRVKDTSFFNLFASPEATKRDAIVPLLEAFPRRKFLLAGDSGEKDPEIYGTLAREHPTQIMRILIRDVTQEGPDAGRYQKAFEGMPKENWQVFRDPEEVKPLPRSLFQ